MVASPKALEHPQACASRDRMPCDDRGHAERTDRRRCAHHTERPGPGLQNVLGIDRQQRGGAAEQDREQVERDRAEDRGIAADEVQAGKQPVDAFVLGRGGTFDPDQAAEAARDQRQHCHQRERRAWREGISEPADGRAADGRDLPGAGRKRSRPLQHAVRRDGWQQRGRSGAFEGAAKPEHAENDEDLGRAQRPHQQPHGKIASGEPLRQLAELDDAAAVVAVGRVAGDEHEQCARNELHEAGEAEIEGAAGQRIDLPADSDRGDLIGEFRQGARGDVEQQRRVSRQRDGRGGKCRSSHVEPQNWHRSRRRRLMRWFT